MIYNKLKYLFALVGIFVAYNLLFASDVVQNNDRDSVIVSVSCDGSGNFIAMVKQMRGKLISPLI